MDMKRCMTQAARLDFGPGRMAGCIGWDGSPDQDLYEWC